MKPKIKYADEPIDARVVRDFLPPPAQLVPRDDSVKVTISLSRRSVAFFKSEASKNNTQYQRMIRHLIDHYVDQYESDSPSGRHTKAGAEK